MTPRLPGTRRWSRRGRAAGRAGDGAPGARPAGLDAWTWVVIVGTAVVLVLLAYVLDLLGGRAAVAPAPVSGGTGATR